MKDGGQRERIASQWVGESGGGTKMSPIKKRDKWREESVRRKSRVWGGERS